MIVLLSVATGVFGLYLRSVVRGLRDNANASAVLAETEARRRTGGAL